MQNKLEQTINDFFQSNHKEIKTWAVNCLKLIRRTDLWADLVSETYLYTIKFQDKLQPQIEKGQLKACVIQYMSGQVNWSNTTFKTKFIKSNQHISDLEIELADQYFNHSEEEQDEEEFFQEEKFIQDKLGMIYSNLAQLPVDQRILFDLIYNQGYNTSSKLQKYYADNMPNSFKAPARISCWRQMSNLKYMLTSGATQTN